LKPTQYLKSVGIDIFLEGHNSYKLASMGFMDLTVESWQEGRNTIVSMCHYGEQNGDLMADPEIVFKVGGKGVYFGMISYREQVNHYVNFSSVDHAEIKDFMENTWIDNLIQQGHKVYEKDIETQ